jgi:nucleotide-binding universal stress UspA family protein
MSVVVWIAEGGWEACVDTAAEVPAREYTLLHVTAPPHHGVDLLGRHPPRDVRERYAEVAGVAADDLLAAAEERLRHRGTGAAIRRIAAAGRPEDVVVAACASVDAIVLARSGRRPGPHSLEHATRFVVDHAPCTVVLTWP